MPKQITFKKTFSKKNVSRKKAIINSLQKALLQGGKMEYGLYEYEMEEHLDYWYAGLIADSEELVFVLTENSGHVAMVLITKDRTVYVNEDAREKLSQSSIFAYEHNMKLLIPQMAEDIDQGFFSVNGVVVANKSPRKLGISKGFG